MWFSTPLDEGSSYPRAALFVESSVFHGSVLPTKPQFGGRPPLFRNVGQPTRCPRRLWKGRACSGLCLPWRVQAGDEIDQAARVSPFGVFVGDEVGDREANEPPRLYQRS
jgi:hypothetical protein